MSYRVSSLSPRPGLTTADLIITAAGAHDRRRGGPEKETRTGGDSRPWLMGAAHQPVMESGCRPIVCAISRGVGGTLVAHVYTPPKPQIHLGAHVPVLSFASVVYLVWMARINID